MKKKLSALLSCAMLFTLLGGCAPKAPVEEAPQPETPPVSQPSVEAPQEEPTPQQPSDSRPQVNFTVLSGPTGVGAAKLISDSKDGTTINNYSVNVVAANDEVTAALINGSTDIAAVATNVAANLSVKTNGNIQVLAINTLGVLYILEKGDTVHSMADLSGKTLYATGQGANPEYALNYLLRKNDVDPSQVDIQWMTPQEVTAKMVAEENAICMLPVPAATGLMNKDTTVREALSLSAEWDKLDQGALAMGCVVVRTDYAKENPQIVEDFLSDYQASIEYMNDPTQRQDAAKLVAEHGITANEAIAVKAIPQCNLTFFTGEEMHSVLEQYYQVLFEANPAAIGGSMPYDSFYYGLD